MRYYWIKQHKLYTDIPQIINWYGRISPDDISRERAKWIPRRVLLSVSANSHMTFTGIISKPFFLVNEEVRNVITMYDDTIPYKQIVLLDSVNGSAELYSLPILERLECLDLESRLMLDRGRLSEALIDEEKIRKLPIFCVNSQSAHIAIRIDLAESILKRDSRGIALEPVKIVERGSR